MSEGSRGWKKTRQTNWFAFSHLNTEYDTGGCATRILLHIPQLFFFTPWQHSIDSKNMTCNLKDAQLPRDVQWVNQLWGFCQLCWGEDFWSERHSRGHPMERRLAGPRRHLWRLQRGKPVWHQKFDRRVTLDLRGSFLDQLPLFILCLHFLGIFINIYRNHLHQQSIWHKKLDQCITLLWITSHHSSSLPSGDPHFTKELHVHYQYITSTLQVHYKYITSTLQVHHKYITSTLQVHYKYNTGT